MTRSTIGNILFAALGLALGACTFDDADLALDPALGEATGEVVQTCTARNVIGALYEGVVCGGSVIDDCSKGVLYSCRRQGTSNNCTFQQSCAIGCLTGPTSTDVAVNTSRPRAQDACFNGPAPLTLSATTTQGGNYVTMTATLTLAHSPFAVVNLEGTNFVVPPLCNVPLLMPPTQNTLSFVEPTGVVSVNTAVPLNVLTSFNDSTGKSRNLVSVPTTLTLTPGGSVSVPPLATFDVTNASGTPITTIVGGTNAFTHGTLALPAPVGGVNATVTTSPASAFTTNGSFTIPAGCSESTTSGVLTATSGLSSNLAATVTATTGTGPITRNVTITPPVLAIRSIALVPSTVNSGNTLTATVTLNRNVSASDASSTTSIRISEGLVSHAKIAMFPGCTGTPVCTGPLTVPVGSRTASVTLTALSVSSQDISTVSVDASWSNNTASAQLTVNP